MSIIDRIKKRLSYTEVAELKYTEGLREAYNGTSISGGSLVGKNVVVTGGGSGIGLAIARRYLSEKCRVTITGRNEAKLVSAIASLNDAGYREVDYVVMDQLEACQVKGVISSMNSEMIDIWVNCAGVFTNQDQKRSFRGINEDTYISVINTNFKSVALICNFLAEAWVKNNKEGQIINISSICGVFPAYGHTVYGISKKSVIALTRQLSRKYEENNINFSCIAPGSVATALAHKKISDNISTQSNILTRHISLPEEIAALVVFLSTPVGKLIRNIPLRACAGEEFV